MSRLFRNDSPGALTRDQAVALMKERIAARTGGNASHDVSNEPRVPKGSGDESGEWTSGGSSTPANGNAHATVSADGHTVTITYPDGTTEVRQGGDLPWLSNNPQSLMDGPLTKRHGAIGHLPGGLAIFPDAATGEAAAEALLNGGTYSSLTIDNAIESRSSKKAGNNPERIKQQVHQFSGLPGDAIIKDLTPEEKQRLYAAIRRTESGRPGTVRRTRP